MAALEERLDRAMRAKSSEQRARKLLGAWVLAAAASYAVEALFLGAFAALGVVAPRLPVLYAIGGVLISAFFYVVSAAGWNRWLRDPSMVVAQCVCGVAMQMAVVLAAPRIFFPYVANLFTVFAFAMIWLPVRSSIALWLAGSAAVGAALYALGERISVSYATLAEMAVTWLFFSAVLGRCVFLSVYATGMRLRLTESRGRLAQSLEQIEELATHDELTKALNRRALIARVEEERRRSGRSGQPVSVALFDLDHFKAVNDRYGHAGGDEVLRRFAAIVHATMRDTDVFGRYGGEEFMLILPGTVADASRIAVERIRAALAANDWSPVDEALRVTASTGIAQLRGGESSEALLRRADEALYRAKGDGRDCIRMA